MTDFRGVVEAWRKADPKHIHPTREHESESAYWESGELQAQLVRNLMHEIGEENPTVLDFGCGDGRIALPMALLGINVIAVDAAPEMIERLRQEAEKRRIVLETRVWDGIGLPDFPPIHAVNARAVLIHHGHDAVEVMVGNLAALLKPGGLFIADWPIGAVEHERRDWIDVTTWDYMHRHCVASDAGLELVSEGEPRVRPSVWRKQ